MSPSAGEIAIFPTQPLLKQYRTDLLNSSPSSNPLPQNLISGHSNPSTFKPVNQLLHLTMNASTSSLEVENGYMEKELKRFDILLHQMSSEWSTKSPTVKEESMSMPPSMWVLLPFYDVENLRGIRGPQTPIDSISPINMLSSS